MAREIVIKINMLILLKMYTHMYIHKTSSECSNVLFVTQ